VQLIVKTMMRLHADKKLQLGGTTLIKALVDGQPEGRRALADIPGGLDWLCQVRPRLA
jgi:hypothetical protein